MAPYSKFHTDWLNAPDTSTPITDEALEHIEEGIATAQDDADSALAAIGVAIPNAIVNAKGDLVTATADDTPARQAVGSNGQFLKADSTQTTGLIWAALTSAEILAALGDPIGLGDGTDISTGTTTGTKIGTATSQKIGFFNATPIVQPANTTDLRTALINLGLLATGGATPLDLNGGALTSGSHTFADGTNIVVNTTTGTKIGTSSSQKIGFWNATPVVRQGTYSVTNRTTDRTYDCNSTSLDELADIIGTLILDLQTEGLIG